MLFSPISDQPLCPLRKFPLDHLKGFDLKDTTEIPVKGMEMRHPMLTEVHPNRDPVKPCNDWHWL